MSRLKKSTKASRGNGALTAKKLSKKPVATLSVERYGWERCVQCHWEDADDVEVMYRPKPKKGHFWADEIHCMAAAMMCVLVVVCCVVLCACVVCCVLSVA